MFNFFKKNRKTKEIKEFSAQERKQVNSLLKKEYHHLKAASEIDNEIIAIQRSTGVTIPQLSYLHNFMRMKYRWYYKWHMGKYTNIVHWVILAMYIIGIAVTMVWFLNGSIAKAAGSVDTSTVSTATQYSFQRKVFYDESSSKYWSFYFNGTAVEYAYSSDGSSWTPSSTIATGTVADFSVWGESGYVYLGYRAGTTPCSSTGGVAVTKGTISATSISWSASPICAVAGTPHYKINIAKDTSGYIWLSFSTGMTGAVYAVRSPSTNDITGTWPSPTLIQQTGASGVIYENVIMPLVSGDVYIVYALTNSTIIYGKKYTASSTSWASSPTTIASSLTSAALSATVDSASTIHLAYSSGGAVYYRKYSGGSWDSSAVTLDSNSGNAGISISVNLSNNLITASWVRSNAIYYKTSMSPWGSSDWSSATTFYSTGTNIYPSLSRIAHNKYSLITWTNGTGSPYTVYFDRISSPSATVDTSSSASATAKSFQRKVFYDPTYSKHWSYYYNGSAIEYAYSSDGNSWTSVGTISSNLDDFSLFRYRSDVYIIYSDGTNLNVNKGSYNASSVSWGTPTTVETTGSPSNVNIFFDSNNEYLWISYQDTSDCSGGSSVFTRRSTNTSDISSWQSKSRIYPDSCGSGGTPIQSAMSSLGGGDMLAVIATDGAVKSKKYSASTGWEASSVDIDSSVTSGSISLSGNQNIAHLAYLDGGVVYYSNYISGSWLSSVTIDSNTTNSSPTISVNPLNDDAYIYYIRSNVVYYKRGMESYATANWDSTANSLYALGTNTNVNTSLLCTSNKCSVEWTGGGSDPYAVNFFNLSVPDASLVDTSTSSSATIYSYQRKVFYDSGSARHWSFYFNGSNIEYSYSSDGGYSWASSGNFDSSDHPSIYYNSGNVVIAYHQQINYDIYTYVRSGSISGTSITWGSDYQALVSAYAHMPYITKDSTGYYWVSCVDYDSYDVYVNRSTNINDVTSWVGQTSISSTNYLSYPVTLSPLASGDMYATYFCNQTSVWKLCGKKYTASTTTWDASETVIDSSVASDANFSSVVESSGNIHLAYTDNGAAYYMKYSSGSWGSAVTIDSNSGNSSPTISVNSTTSDLVFAYIRDNNIYYKKGASPHTSTYWDTTATEEYGYGTNTFLTSSYDITNNEASLLWTNGGASPYNVMFDTIDSPPNVSISGTCKQYDQSTNCADSESIKVAINGVISSKTATISSGAWTISGVQVADNDVLTVFVDNVADDKEANAVVKLGTAGNVTDVELYERHLTIGASPNQTISNTDISIYDYSVSADEDIFFEVDESGNLSIPASGSSTYSDQELIIKSSNTWQPKSSGSVTSTLPNLEIPTGATLIANANTINLTATGTPLVKTGTFTYGTSTLKYTGGGDVTIASGTYYNLESSPATSASGGFTISGAGTTAYNATYTESGTYNSKPSYTDGTHWLFNDYAESPAANFWCLSTSKFNINYPNMQCVYYSGSATLPGAGTWYTGSGGTAPVPTLTENASSYTHTFASGTLTVANNYTNGDGTHSVTTTATTNDPNLDINGNFSNAASATFIASDSGSLTVAGDFSLNTTSIFTNSSATVVLDGSGAQTVTAGGTGTGHTFNNLTVTNASTAGVSFADSCTVTGTFTDTTANSKLTFDALSTYAFANININGQATGTKITMVSNDPANATPANRQWYFNVTQTSPTASYVHVTDSDANGGNLITPTSCTNGGNNENWDFGISLIGTVYTADNKSADIGAGKTIAVSVNGGAKTTVETTTGGAFSIRKMINTNEPIVIFIDDETEEGSYVSQIDAVDVDITGIELFQNKVILDHYTSGPMTNTLLATADNCADDDLKFSVSGSDATFNSAFETYILTGKNYTPGGVVSAGDFEVAGTATYNGGANAFTASGSLVIASGATWTHTGTATFASASGTKIIDAQGKSFANTVINNSGAATWSVSSALDINGTFTLGGGVLDLDTSDPNVNISGNISVTGGSVMAGSGTVIFDGDMTYSAIAGINFGIVQIGTSPDTTDLSSDFTCTSLTVAAGDVFNTNGYEVTASGSITINSTATFDATDDVENDTSIINVGTDWANSGTFTADDSTIVMTGTTNTFAGNGQSYYKLQISGGITASTSDTTITNTLTIDSTKTLTIDTGRTVTMAGGATTTITGTITGAGTLTLAGSAGANLGTGGTLSSLVRFDATDGNSATPARTYGGQVEFYSASASNRVTVLGTASSQTISFSSFFYVNAAGDGEMSVQADTYNPTINLTGTMDFTGSGSGSEDIHMGSGTWTLYKNWDARGGTIDAGTSTLKTIYSLGTGNCTIYPGTSEYYNFNIAGLHDIYISIGSNPLIVKGNMTFGRNRLGGDNTVDLHGNLTLSGTYSRGSGSTATGIKFVGTGDQTLTGTGGPNLTVEKDSGTFILANNLNAQSFTYVKGDVSGVDNHTIGFVDTWNGVFVPGSITYGGIEIKKNDAGDNNTVTGTANISGNLTFTNGWINGGAFNVAGNVIIATTSDGGNTAITLNGTGNQSYTLSTGVTPTSDLTINKTAGTATITGSGNLHNIILSDGALSFAGGYTYTIDDADAITTASGTLIDFNGSSGNLVTLASDTTAQWDLTVAGQYSAKYVAVSYSNAAGGKEIVAYQSTDNLNNTNWVFDDSSFYWTNGTGDGLFSTANNWTTGTTPSASSAVVYKSISTDNCSIDTTVSVTSVDIQSTYSGTITTASGNSLTTSGSFTLSAGTFDSNGQSLTIASYSQGGGTLTAGASTITCSGDFTITSGTFTAGTSTLALNGTATQTLTAGTKSFNNITVTNASAAGTTFADSLTVTGTFTDVTPSSKLTFDALSTYGFANININGQATGTKIVMVSNDPANVTPADRQWYFNVSQTSPQARYVNVTDSDANGGNVISTVVSIDGGNNENWLFGNDPVNNSLTLTNPYSGTSDTVISDDTVEWNLRALVTDDDGGTDIDCIELGLANSTDSSTPFNSLRFRWTESTDAFSEIYDTQSAATITSTSSNSNLSTNQWTIDFKIKINSSFASKDTAYSAEIYTLDDSSGSDSDTYASIYRVTALSIDAQVDYNSLNFGQLLPGSVLTGTTNITVTTNSPNGYSISVNDSIPSSYSALLHQIDSTTRIGDYSGTVTTPSSWTSGTGLGICVYSATGKDSKWGTGTVEADSNNYYAGVPENSGVIHYKSGSPTTSDLTKVGYRLVVPNTQKTGNYSGVVQYTMTTVLN